MPKYNLEDKVVVVTGASSGIGEAIALELARKGAKLVIAARNIEKLECLASKISSDGKEVLVVPTDVSKEEDCRTLIQNAVEKFGTVHALINNAGISMRALFKDLQLDVIRKVMNVNFWGAVYCTKYALPYLLENKGSVTGISSIAGFKGLPARTGYSASKFALQGFLEVLRIENLKTGLHVMTACPGFTASNIRNVALVADGSVQGESPRNENKMMKPDKVAKKIINGIEKRKTTIIMGSQGKMLNILNKFFPQIADKAVYINLAKEIDSPFK